MLTDLFFPVSKSGAPVSTRATSCDTAAAIQGMKRIAYQSCPIPSTERPLCIHSIWAKKLSEGSELCTYQFYVCLWYSYSGIQNVVNEHGIVELIIGDGQHYDREGKMDAFLFQRRDFVQPRWTGGDWVEEYMTFSVQFKKGSRIDTVFLGNQFDPHRVLERLSFPALDCGGVVTDSQPIITSLHSTCEECTFWIENLPVLNGYTINVYTVDDYWIERVDDWGQSPKDGRIFVRVPCSYFEHAGRVEITGRRGPWNEPLRKWTLELPPFLDVPSDVRDKAIPKWELVRVKPRDGSCLYYIQLKSDHPESVFYQLFDGELTDEQYANFETWYKETPWNWGGTKGLLRTNKDYQSPRRTLSGEYARYYVAPGVYTIVVSVGRCRIPIKIVVPPCIIDWHDDVPTGDDPDRVDDDPRIRPGSAIGVDEDDLGGYNGPEKSLLKSAHPDLLRLSPSGMNLKSILTRYND